MKIFWKAQILEMAESDIFCVKRSDDHDSGNRTWLQSVFAELKKFICQKVSFQNVLQKGKLKVLFPTRLRANGDCKVTKKKRFVILVH